MNEADKPELVAAARGGDQEAQEFLVRHLLTLAYNVVGRAVSRRPDIDHIAREAVLRVIRGLPGASTARGMRTEVTRMSLRLAAEPPPGRADVEEYLVDFDEQALLRAQLSGELQALIHAGRWLDGATRIVWSLWWLEATGKMERADIAHVLAETAGGTDARVDHMLGQLETARTVTAALTVSRCGDLNGCTAGWDGRPDATWRERIAGHVRQCADCFALTLGRVAPETLLADDLLVPVPTPLVDSVVAALRDEPRGRVAARHRAAARPGRKGRAPVAAGAAAVVAALGVAYTVMPADRVDPSGRAAGAVVTPATSSPSVSDDPTASPSSTTASAKPGTSPKTRKETRTEKATEASATPAEAAAGRTRAGCGSTLASPWADWPMPNARTGGLPHPASYTNLGDGTVRDNVTCLRWQRAKAPGTHTFAKARSYCADLDLDGGGWRLPTRIEVLSLVDTARSGPAIDTAAFPGTPAQFFWTSSPWAVTKTPLRAWIVNFYEGLTSNAAYQSGSYQVRCVRGGSGTGRPAYRVSAGQVTDPATGLTWQRAGAPGTMTAASADGYCAALSLGGRAWRLPTVKELATLVDDGRVTPAIDRTAFPDTPGTGAYWSSSVFAPDPSQRWFLSYNDGITSHRSLDGAHVRCVS
ncbi:DUF1566 domain-containing protein [Streptomyces tauricus]|uniref:DUF1566 domain-containing protein n=1 Tax=Streptomyces tauricus TaxID=68274 RepID=UPI0034355BB3